MEPPFLSMNMSSVQESEGNLVFKVIPPQIAESERQLIMSSTKKANKLVKSVSSGNFVVSLLLAGSMQQLWSMIRTMKTIIMAGLVEIPMPAHALVYMQGCMTLAQMDVFDGEGLYY
jgi:hypothetical protein